MPTLPPPPPALLDGASLFLDFDGTLVELADRHDAVVADDAVKALLPALVHALGGRVAVVSGRPADQIIAYLDVDPAAPGFAVAGSHGLETIWPDGRRSAPDRPAALDRAIETLEDAATRMPGVVIEPKPFGVAIHYRQAPDRQSECDTLGERMAREAGLELQRGKMVCELKMAGADKGDAVRALLAAAPMTGARAVFVGDDLTDEAGFRAAHDSGGGGVLVGFREGTAAIFALPDVAAVHAWLATASARAA
jgi:trehalose 6-phosphate phosphatase